MDIQKDNEKQLKRPAEKDGKAEVQKSTDGEGPLYHRRYFIDLDHVIDSPEVLTEALKKDINAFSPQILATFEKTKGSETEMKVGDEFMVHITGPWNGPVRVSEVTPLSFTLVTLNGHLEAGRIKFSFEKHQRGVRFLIESFARSADHIVDFLYDKVPVVRLAQKEMWIEYCRAVARFATGDIENDDDVQVLTEKRRDGESVWEEV